MLNVQMDSMPVARSFFSKQCSHPHTATTSKVTYISVKKRLSQAVNRRVGINEINMIPNNDKKANKLERRERTN
jgi:hypothetical protein